MPVAYASYDLGLAKFYMTGLEMSLERVLKKNWKISCFRKIETQCKRLRVNVRTF